MLYTSQNEPAEDRQSARPRPRPATSLVAPKSDGGSPINHQLSTINYPLSPVPLFLRDRTLPHLDTGLDRLDRIAAMVHELPAPERARLSPRVTMLQTWEKKTRRILPIIVKILRG